jgi:signal transduction histidine kinase/ActR/RegA family two-component response regulator
MPDELGSDRYVWRVAQGPDDTIFFGQDGILQFDGENIINLGPEHLQVARGLCFDEAGNLWAAAYNEIGYYPKSTAGFGAFVSMRAHIDPEHRNFGEAWDLRWYDHAIWLAAHNRLLRWDGSAFSVWQIPSIAQLIVHFLHGGIYIHVTGKGLYRLEDDLVLPFSVHDAVAGASIVFMQVARDDTLLCVSRRGLLTIDKATGELLEAHSCPELERAVPTGGLRTRAGQLFVGTMHGGLLRIEDNQAFPVAILSTGLPSNTVLSLFEDRDGALWLTMPEGVMRVHVNLSASWFNLRREEGQAMLRDFAVGADAWYLAAISGVYQYSPDAPDMRSFTRKSPGVTSSLALHNGRMLAAQMRAIVACADTGLHTLMELSGEIFQLVPSSIRAGMLYARLSDQIVICRELPSAEWEVLGAIPITGWYLMEDRLGDLWLRIPSGGLTRLQLDAAGGLLARHDFTSIGAYDLSATTFRSGPAGSAWAVLMRAGYALYDGAGWQAHAWPQGPLPAPLSHYEIDRGGGPVIGWGVYRDPQSDLDRMLAIELDAAGGLTWRAQPTLDLNAVGSIQVFRAHASGDHMLFFAGGPRGMLVWRADLAGQMAPPRAPRLSPPVLDGVAQAAATAGHWQLPFDYGSLDFRFSAPEYTAHRRIFYQTRLDGRDWSPPTASPQREIGRLYAGRHRFEVRAIDGNGLASPAVALAFRVLPPWYRAPWAYAGYVLLLGSGVWLLIRTRERQLRLRHEELETLVSQRTAELEKVSRFKTDFIAGMSHEIRNPLNGVIGLIQRLRVGAPVPERNLQALRRAAQYLQTTVEEILDFSRIESGAVHIEKRPFEPESLLAGVLQIYAERAASKGLELTSQLRCPEGIQVLSDPSKIQQIAGNLIGNAIKFTDAGSVHLSLSVELSGADEGLLKFRVRDSGPGIAPEEQEAVFEKYYQSAANTAGRRAGTGLGLALCRQFCTALGGHISLHSKPGEGASFTVAIPVGIVAAPSAVDAIEDERTLAGLHVLLVEDLEYNRLFLEDFLQDAGCTVQSCDNGIDGLARARAENWDAILLDWDLPGLTGIEIAGQLRRNNWVPPTTRIIGMTAFATPEMREQCLRGGMDAFVAKPIHMGQLRRLLGAPDARDASPPPPSGAGLPVSANLDLGLLEKLGAAQPGGLAAQVARYLDIMNTCATRLDTVLTAAQPDCAEARSAAHALLGHVRMLGEVPPCGALSDLLTAAHAGDAEGVRKEWAVAQRDLATLRAALAAFQAAG